MFIAPKRSKVTRFIKWLVSGAVVFLVIAVGYYFYNSTVPLGTSSQLQSFTISPKWGSTRISEELKTAGLIRSPLVFQFYTWTHGISSRLQDGVYQLAPDMTIPEIARILNHGAGTSKEMELTFIEGWSDQDVAQYLQEKGVATQSGFFAVIQKKADWWDQFSFLETKPKNLDLEGYLFPDTYRFYRTATVSDIVQRMLENFDTKLTPDLRAEISRQGKTIHDIITVASIVEKEVSSDADRKIVAGIFYKRLAAGIPLQTDSTVNYATGKSQTRSSGKDLQVDSPYNTYLHKGLPPGPICNPGMSAIIAAVYPTPTEYLYFLTTPDGQVIYSKTLVEHNRAKAQYYK